ncbi:non-ribosomal peptide synthetase [Metabacillus malikii]|uniref:Amino acid adenylation domain-containing protein n=1 Tax=Metabacillus malikii TaxID=1504265 RepID=A0ABT9ZKP9_9BACI|nr:non-ribosomal peptide synthetase [Metabacillus malikii]MDQ0232871.1 amino acid adenylation domain-containing protein [Metabacillus malikii]
MSELRYPLTHPQKRIWETEKFIQHSSISNLVGTIKIKGILNFTKIEQAINLFILKNDSIRLRVVEEEDGVKQYISPFQEKTFNIINLQASNKTFHEWVQQETRKPFALIDSDLFEFILFKNGYNESGILAKVHHIISDAWSIHLMAEKLMKYYADLCNGVEVSESKDYSYVDFISRENKYKLSKRFEKNESFWLNELADLPKPISLKESNTAMRSTNAKRKTFTLSKEMTSDIYQFCEKHNLSVFPFFLSILSIYLKRLKGQNQFILGTTILNRLNPVERQTFGMFVSTMPISVKLNDDLTIVELMDQMGHKLMSLLRNQQYPFDLLTRKLRDQYNYIERLFDISLSYQNSKLHINDEAIKDEYETQWHFSEHEINSLNIHINDREEKNELMLDFDYLTELFTEEEIETHYNRMIQIILNLFKDENCPISQLDILPPREKDLLITDFNSKKAEFDRTKTVHRIFEEQAAKTPDKAAVVYGNQTLTYKELNHQANRLARVLRKEGVEATTRVGVMTDRSMDMIIAIFAVIKAGGTYIPLDPYYPTGRIHYMIENSGLELLLTNVQTEQLEFTGKIIDLVSAKIDQESVENLREISSAQDLIYIMYTSGSTGRPKGIGINHQALHQNIHGFTEAIQFSENQTILSLISMSFDPFVIESFLPLSLGMTVIIANEEQRQNPEKTKDLIRWHEVDVIQLTPSRLRLLLEEDTASLHHLKKVLVGGEPLTNNLVQKIKQKTTARLYNIYGPTETTVWSTFKEINHDADTITVGKPIANREIYILDTNEKLQPIGVIGEVCISGGGIANGYLSNPEQTSLKFVKNPFQPNLMMYKTGDLGRWLPNGELEVLGRNDDQVKINGVRMELGEIHNQIDSHPKIKESVVTVKQWNNGKYLCAYYIAKEPVKIEEIRGYLTYNLPHAMIPTYYFPMEEFPLTPNGKVDHKRLQDPFIENKTKHVYVAPSTEAEMKLTNIWGKLFNQHPSKIGIHDHFLDLGGHSLKAIELVVQVQKEFQVNLSIKETFQYATIQKLAKHIESLVKQSQEKIERVTYQKYYQASTSQKRLYIINTTNHTTSYNMPGAFKINGAVDFKQINDIFQKIVERHEAFRTSFKMVDGALVQEIHREVDFNVELIELQNADPRGKIQTLIEPFDLSSAPLLRVYLLHEQADQWILFVDMHHIISDGTSIEILMEDFIQLYEGKNLPPLQVQYKDFSHWQEGQMVSSEMKKQESYWQEVFSKEVQNINLPLDRVRPSQPSYAGEQVTFSIEKDLLSSLKEVARGQEATLFMTVFSIYNILLSKYSGQEDITVGIPVIGRKHNEIKNVIGMFVNTLAIRSYPDSNLSFKEFLCSVKENLLKTYENQDYPFEHLIELLEIQINRNQAPLFDTIFTMQDKKIESLTVGDLEIQSVEVTSKDIKFDLSFEAVERENQLQVKILYSTALFNQSTIERMVDGFMEIVQRVTTEPNTSLKDIVLLDKAEQQKQIYEWNDTKHLVDVSKGYHEKLEEQVNRTPYHTAVFENDTGLTYMELNQKANKVARYLRSVGVAPDDLVGIMLERSTDMLIGILGILKAGAAYLPINPHLPAERIQYMIQDSEINVLVTSGSMKQEIVFSGLTIHLHDDEIKKQDHTNLPSVTKPTSLAYVIYTSGSTGNPKGVMIEHQSLINRIDWMQSRYPLTEEDIIMQKTPFTFDVSVWELLWSSLYGAKVYMLPPNGEKDPAIICEAIEKHRITAMHFVPTMFSMFLDHLKYYKGSYDLSSLRQIFTSGEALLSSHVTAFHQYVKKEFGTRLTNLYGPTEATIDVSYYDCEDEYVSTVPIGKPIYNTSLYILNKHHHIQPVGVEGELYISGIGLARGYLNRQELTDEKFVDNPFIPGSKMYQTGDIAKYLPDGNIEYIGRTDDQVKIRGNRVEIGEIETNLTGYDSITDAVVLPIQDENGNYELFAYYVASQPIPNMELRNYQSKMLPDYMLPSMYVFVERMPLNASCKVDRKELQKLKNVTKSSEFMVASNEVEQKLTRIWADVLHIDEQKIGINDSFFELGGHSLKAISIISKVYEEFATTLSLKDVFHSPTIKEQAEILVKNGNEEAYSKIEVVKKREYYPLTPSQKQLYILEQVNDMDSSYHLYEALSIKGPLDKERFWSSLQKLVDRHESFRTSFSYRDGELIQVIHENINIDKVEESDSYQNIEQRIKEFITPFDLGEAPLFRSMLVQLEENEHLFLFDMHHIIADGVSIDILIRDFVAFYQGEALPEMNIQYKDYAVWKEKQMQTETMQKQAMYWKDVFHKEVSPLELPYDFTRPDILTIEGETLSMEVDQQTFTAIRTMTEKLNKTSYVLLFGVYNVLLSKYTGQHDVVVGTPFAGRQYHELKNVIGMFVNTLPIRSYPENHKSFIQYVEELNECILSANENQDYPFENLLDDLQIQRFKNQNPLFHTMFDMKVSSHDINMEGLHIINYPMNRGTAKFDLSLETEELGENYILRFEYNTHLFKEETIKIVAEDFLKILDTVLSHPYQPLGELVLETKIKELKPIAIEDVNFTF